MSVKKLFLLLFVSLIGSANLQADNMKFGIWKELSCSISPRYNRHIRRSPIKEDIRIYQSPGYILISGVSSEQAANVTIANDNGMVVKNETIAVMPEQETTIYIGDLTSGTYDLTIELESYTLEGCFDVE